MDDTAACADLCESHGFAAPAAALRALAEGRAPFYLVRSRMDARYDPIEKFDEVDIVPAVRGIFRNRFAAERQARILTVRALRNFRPDLWYGPTPEFVRGIGVILGIAYELPEVGRLAFPDWATDEQLCNIGELLPFTMFDVVEVAAL